MEANKHIDENAAKILLERGLILNKHNKYEYSRDIKLVTGLSMRDYHSEYVGIYECLFEKLKSPVLLIYAVPAPYGEEVFITFD